MYVRTFRIPVMETLRFARHHVEVASGVGLSLLFLLLICHRDLKVTLRGTTAARGRWTRYSHLVHVYS